MVDFKIVYIIFWPGQNIVDSLYLGFVRAQEREKVRDRERKIAIKEPRHYFEIIESNLL